MTERSDHNLEAQITSKMRELIACMCVVEFKQEGDRRGMIERIESLILGKDFAESFERSQFRVHLTSGDIVVVPGSAISAIESTSAASHASKTRKTRKKPGMKARKGRTNNMLAEKRKSIAMKTSKAAARARTPKAKERKRVRENEG
jgi:hypothetical protein